jgi:hypothetical protein
MSLNTDKLNRVPMTPLVPVMGSTSRLELLKAELNERRLKECSDMLTDVGVPEWVMNSNSDGVPGNSVVCRLKWYLARRKNVKAGEIDQKLQREMAEMLHYAQAR